MPVLSLIIERDVDDPDAAEVLVDATLLGQPYRCLLDTGAARTSWPHDPLTATLPRVDTQRGSGVFQRFEEDLVVVPEIVVGPLHRTNMVTARSAQRSNPRRPLIGMDFLRDHHLRFDFREQRVNVDSTDPGTAHADQPLWLDAGGHPYVTLHLGPTQAQVVWDTGAGMTVVDRGFTAQHPEFFTTFGTSTGTDATGISVETPLLQMAEHVIGGVRFPPQRVAVVDLSGANATLEVPMDVILGFNILNQAEWVFDFPHRRWGVARYPD